MNKKNKWNGWEIYRVIMPMIAVIVGVFYFLLTEELTIETGIGGWQLKISGVLLMIIAVFGVLTVFAEPLWKIFKSKNDKKKSKAKKAEELMVVIDKKTAELKEKKLRTLSLYKRDGSLYSYDMCDDDIIGHNGAIYGESHKNQSTMMKMLITSTMCPRIKKEGGKIFVIDFEKESPYKDIINSVGGSIIPIGINEKYSINPFPTQELFIKDYEFEELFWLHGIIDMIIENTGHTPIEELKREIVVKAIKIMYKNLKNPLLGDLPKYIQEVDSELPQLKDNILKSLTDFIENNPLSEIISRESNITYTNSPFVIFDLHSIENLPDNMKELFTFVVMREFKDKAYDMDGFKFIIMNRCTQYLKSRNAIMFLEQLLAEARRYKVGVWTVMQKYVSHKKDKISSAIRNTTATVIFLSDKKEIRELIIDEYWIKDIEKTGFNNITASKEILETFFVIRFRKGVKSDFYHIFLKEKNHE